jgi:ribosomal protein L21E
MREAIKLLDVVALTVDLPKHSLWRGQVGTVIEILAHGNAFEVEFSDSDGRTYKSLGLRPDQIMVLHYEPSPVRELVPA